jgi:predicted nucleic acid-binding protein
LKLADALRGVTKLGIDTSPIIYFVEATPRYLPACREVFRAIAAGAVTGYTSVLTLTEVLVHPLRTADAALETNYSNLLLSAPNVVCNGIDVSIARKAAELRAAYGLRTPDAIQVATALHTRCEAFITNDTGLRRVTDLRVLILDELTL